MKPKFDMVVLHFGSDKAGSSAIQTALNLWRKQLIESGLIAYPPGAWHPQFGSYFCDEPERFIYHQLIGATDHQAVRQSDEDWFANFSRWLEDSPPARSLVLSYEGFTSLPAQALVRIRDFCGQWAREVRVVFYVRPPLSYAVSAIGQRAQMGMRLWARDDIPYVPHKTYLEAVKQIFDAASVNVRCFTPEALAGGDIVTDFMKNLGVPLELMARMVDNGERVNNAITDAGRRLGENLRQRLADRGLRLAPGDFHSTYGQFLYMIPGESIRLTQEQADLVLEASAPHSNYLASRHGVHFSERADRFVIGPDTPPLANGELIAAVARFIARAVGQQMDLHPDAMSLDAEFLASSGPTQPIPYGEAARFDLIFAMKRGLADIELIIHVCAGDGTPVLDGADVEVQGEVGIYRVACTLQASLAAGRYALGFALRYRSALGHYADLVRIKRAVEFTIVGRPSAGVVAAIPTLSYTVNRVSACAADQLGDGRGMVEIAAWPPSVAAGKVFELLSVLRNGSDESWLNISQAPLSLCYHWYDSAGSLTVFDGLRTALPVCILAPGEEVAVTMHIEAPFQPGRFRLAVLPVKDNVAWLDSTGFTPLELNIEVQPWSVQSVGG